MASAVDSRLAYARLSAVATASRLPTANRGSNNSYTTSWDTTHVPGVRRLIGERCPKVVIGPAETTNHIVRIENDRQIGTTYPGW